MSTKWPLVSLSELIRLERRPVDLKPEQQYQEIGIYCFGRGIFHKTPRTGLEIGDKDLYELREGDVILQVTFAWEGAIALCSKAEHGLYGSTRYPTFRVDETRCFAPFLIRYLGTRKGLEQINKICPGSAGRNRVLSIKRIHEVVVPLPPLPEQRRIVARIEDLAGKINEARTLRQQATEEAEVLISRATSSLVDEAGWTVHQLGDMLAETPRNGLSPKPELENGGRPMLRINAVSSSATRFVDLTAVKMVQVSDEEATPFELRHDDVFIVRYNGDIDRVAKPGIYKGTDSYSSIYPDKLMRLRPDRSKCCQTFLSLHLVREVSDSKSNGLERQRRGT